MPSPAVSVAMSVYNGERFLAEAIDSVVAQSFADFELLILDDGSRDGTPAILRRNAAQDPRIRVISRENRGLVASLNQLLAESRAPLIARMDADDICHPERFARQVAFLQAHPNFGVIGSWSDDIDEHGHSCPITGQQHATTWKDFLQAIENDDQLLCHSSVMYRREVVLAVGGYHAAFRHCEDLDLWLRLASVTRMASLPEPLIRYRRYPGQVSNAHATEQQIGAAIARLAYRARRDGRVDPTAQLTRLPPIDQLDAVFGQPGASRWVRDRVATGLLYSKSGLSSDGFDLVVRHLREGGARDGMWRTVARLIRFGEPLRAMRLAATLATT